MLVPQTSIVLIIIIIIITSYERNVQFLVSITVDICLLKKTLFSNEFYNIVFINVILSSLSRYRKFQLRSS